MVDGHEIHSCKHCQPLVIHLHGRTPLTSDLLRLFNRQELSAEVMKCPLFAYIDGILDINVDKHNKSLTEAFVAWYKKTFNWKSSNAFLELSGNAVVYGKHSSRILQLHVAAIQGTMDSLPTP